MGKRIFDFLHSLKPTAEPADNGKDKTNVQDTQMLDLD
jgi:hypothetical protein